MSTESPDFSIDFREAVHLASFAVVITSFENGEQPIRYINPAFTALTGYLLEEIEGLNCRFLQGAGTDPATVAELRRALRAGEPICRDLLNYRKDHEPFWNRLTLSPRHDHIGQLIGFLGILVDLSEFRKLEEAKVRAEVLVEGISSAVPGYLFQRVMKPDGSLEFPFLSQGFASLLQLPASRRVSTLDVQRYVHPGDLVGFDAAIKRSAANMTRLTVEFRVVTAEGGQRWLRTTSNPRRIGSDVIWDGIAIDVMAEKDAEERLAFLAYNDPLTGLPNRSLLELSLQNAVSEAKEPSHLALFHVDIIGLQEINDIAGRGGGDAVLRSTASAGDTPNSVRARANLSAALARHRIADVVQKEEIDVFSAPKRARNDGIIITPTLMICLAGTTVTMVGDLSDAAQLDAQLVRALHDG